MEALKKIADKAVADYGFRQAVMWSPEDIIDRWRLSDREALVLRETICGELEALPVPVEPEDIPTESGRIARLIEAALQA